MFLAYQQYHTIAELRHSITKEQVIYIPDNTLFL